MIVVADTSPLCYLILIGKIDVLPKLYRQVLVPSAVIAELLDEDAPAAVRNWAANLPTWICAGVDPVGVTAGMEKLQARRAGRNPPGGIDYGRHDPPGRKIGPSCCCRSGSANHRYDGYIGRSCVARPR